MMRMRFVRKALSYSGCIYYPVLFAILFSLPVAGWSQPLTVIDDSDFDGIFDGTLPPPAVLLSTAAGPSLSPLCDFELEASFPGTVWETEVVDTDHDRIPEIVMTTYRHGTGTLQLHERTAGYNFDQIYESPASYGIYRAFDYDEVAQKLVAFKLPAKIHTFETMGLSTGLSTEYDFYSPVDYLPSRSLTLADTNGNGDVEWIHMSSSETFPLEGRVGFVENDVEIDTFETSTYLFSIAAGDTDGDGLDNVFLGHGGFSLQPFYFSEYTAAGGLVTHSVPSGVYGLPTTVRIIPDVDGDGLPDLAIGAWINSSVHLLIYSMVSGPTLLQDLTLPADSSILDIESVELQPGEPPRLYVGTHAAGGVPGASAKILVVEYNQSLGEYQVACSPLLGGNASFRDIDYADIDGDGFGEIVAARTGVGSGVAVFSLKHPFIRGDLNDDGRVNVADATRLFEFLSGSFTPREVNAADINDSGGIGVDDAIWLLTYLYSQGPEPLPPFAEPGFDTTFSSRLD